MQQFSIFYGWPSAINDGTSLHWSTSQVASLVTKFDSFVLGGDLIQDLAPHAHQIGVGDPNHGDHNNTVSIIRQASFLKPSLTFYGYVALGAKGEGKSGPSFAMGELKRQVDSWVSMGCKGIFVDEFGFDYYNNNTIMRQRQLGIMSYVHNLNLKTILNVWNPDDLLPTENFAALPFNSTLDSVLYESYIYSEASVPETFIQHRVHMKKLANIKSNYNVSLLATSSTKIDVRQMGANDFNYFVASAFADNFDAISWADVAYSATDSRLIYTPIPEFFNGLTVQNVTEDLSAETLIAVMSKGTLTLSYAPMSRGMTMID